jgi:Na+-driven multidrug efflux pump
MGITGVGLATAISHTWNFTVITIICMTIKELRPSFFCPTQESLSQEVGEYLSLGVPSAAMITMEWGATEVLALLASKISIEATGA